jgi:hypothetical protein
VVDIRCTVPVVLNVVEVQLNDGPQVVSDPCGVTVLDQPVGVKNESGGSQCRTVPLGSTYVYSQESMNVESQEGCGNVPQEP